MIETIGASLSGLAEVRATLEKVCETLAAATGDAEVGELVGGAAARLEQIATDVAGVEDILEKSMSNLSQQLNDANQSSSAADGYYKVYEEYAKSLRTWLVAYGIGGPVLLLTNDKVREAVTRSGEARGIARWYLVGVVLQIFLAALNKTVMWAMYFAEVDDNFKSKYRYKFAAWVARQYWIDFILDISSMGLFAWSTYRAFNILVA